jgi:hypothetical protein
VAVAHGEIGAKLGYDDSRSFSDGASQRGGIGGHAAGVLCGRFGGVADYVGGDRGVGGIEWRADDAGASGVAFESTAGTSGFAFDSTAGTSGFAFESTAGASGFAFDSAAGASRLAFDSADDECAAGRYERAGVAVGAVTELRGRFRAEISEFSEGNGNDGISKFSELAELGGKFRTEDCRGMKRGEFWGKVSHGGH